MDRRKIVGVRSVAGAGLGLLLLLANITVTAQVGLLKNQYMEIKPGVTTREDVERRFGKDPNGLPHHVTYKTPALYINIRYGDGCSPETKWAFPTDLVQEVSYSPTDENLLHLNDVILRRSEFKSKRTPGCVIGLIDHYHDAAGIIVVYDKNEKRVDSIDLVPTALQKERYKCSE